MYALPENGLRGPVSCGDLREQRGYTCFPQFGIGVDVRTNDYLAMDVHEWHCNTEFKAVNKKAKKIIKTDADRLRKENNWDFNRLSLVHYLREGMIKCKE